MHATNLEGIDRSPSSHDTSLPPLPPPHHPTSAARRPVPTIGLMNPAMVMMPLVNASLLLLTTGAALIHHSQHVSSCPPDDVIQETVAELLEEYDLPTNKSKRRGGVTGGSARKRIMVAYNRERAHACVLEDWLGPVPKFNDMQFVRTFRISREKAQWIMNCLAKYDTFWTQTYGALGKPSISPQVKFLAAQRRLTYGVSFSAFQDYHQMGESTARLCVSKLTRGIVECPEIAEVYLRAMTKSDAKRVSEMHHQQHGVKGMVGSLDVMKVPWGNCPTGWRGQFQGKEGIPTFGLEAVADYNLWFWHDAFGFPGAINDINVWERSPLYKSFQDGSFAELDFEYEINGEIFEELFVLVDGIYPELSRFLKTISVPLTKIDRNFSGWQEAKRKDVERAFGVLQKKFHFLVHSILFHHREDIFYAVRACIAMHNMMVEERILNDTVEDESFYELVRDVPDTPRVPDRAEKDIDAEDEDFALNSSLADLDNDIVDLDFKARMERAQFLPRKTRIIQRRWHNLYNEDAHIRLQNAVKADVWEQDNGDAADGDELDDFDPAHDI